MNRESRQLELVECHVDLLGTDLGGHGPHDECAGEPGQGCRLFLVVVDGDDLGIGTGAEFLDLAADLGADGVEVSS